MRQRIPAMAASAAMLLACGTAMSLCNRALASDCIWLNPVDGLYSDSTKWSCPIYPWEHDTATFDKAGTYTVSTSGNIMLNGLDAGNGQVAFVATSAFSPVYGMYRINLHGGNFSLAGARPQSLQALYSLAVENNSQITMAGGSMLWIGSSNLGTISINNGAVNLNAPGATSPTFWATKLTSISAGGGSGAMTFQNSATGSFTAIDITNSLTSGAIGQLTIQSGSDVTASGDINIGPSAVAGQIASLTVAGLGSTVVQSGAAALSVGAASDNSARLTLTNGASFTTGTGSFTINKTAILKVGDAALNDFSSTFNANGNVLVDGGQLDFFGPNFNLAPGRTFAARNNASVSFTGPANILGIRGGSTYTVESGSAFSTSRPLLIGDNSIGAFVVKGEGSTLSLPAALLQVGRYSGNATLRVEDGAVVTAADLSIADSDAGNTVGVLYITGGAILSVGQSLRVAGQGLTFQTGRVHIYGSNSELRLSGPSAFVGSGAGGTATINVGIDQAGGTLDVGPATLYIRSSGSVTVGTAANSAALKSSGNIQIQGGVLTVARAGTFNWSPGHTLSVSSGQLSSLADFVVPANCTLAVSGGNASFAGRLEMSPASTLSISSAGRVNLSSQSDTAHVGQLNFAGTTDNWSGKLELFNKAMVVESGDLEIITNQIKTGLGGSGGIISSAPGVPFRLGSMSNSDGAGGPIYPSFQGINGLDGSEVLVRYTRIGDLNLDGMVSISDFIDLAAHFNTIGGATWQIGDVNYDGSVTISDFIDLASNFNQSVSGEALPIRDEDAAMLASLGAENGASAVPEPTCLLLVLVTPILILPRRRKLPLASPEVRGVP